METASKPTTVAEPTLEAQLAAARTRLRLEEEAARNSRLGPDRDAIEAKVLETKAAVEQLVLEIERRRVTTPEHLALVRELPEAERLFKSKRDERSRILAAHTSDKAPQPRRVLDALDAEVGKLGYRFSLCAAAKVALENAAAGPALLRRVELAEVEGRALVPPLAEARGRFANWARRVGDLAKRADLPKWERGPFEKAAQRQLDMAKADLEALEKKAAAAKQELEAAVKARDFAIKTFMATLPKPPKAERKDTR